VKSFKPNIGMRALNEKNPVIFHFKITCSRQ
jgi:hypothetical protein